MKIKLGDRVRDDITGFVGIATAYGRYLYDTPQFRIEAEVTKDGKTESMWLNRKRLSVMAESPVEEVEA